MLLPRFVIPPEGACCECGHEIPSSEPEVTLTWVENDYDLHFHAFPCALEAYVAALREPDEWIFTYHRIDADAN